jgi:sugar/nucleoside kinase (ribokinase family)
MTPDILLIGQVTVDDTVPAAPGRWQRRLGGNALYSVAGARLWCDPKRVGMVALIPENLPFDVFEILARAGLSSDGLKRTSQEALIEWIVYEEDGERQSMPRNHALRDPAVDLQTLYNRYVTHLGDLSASFQDIPEDWLPAKAIHLAPQVAERHREACVALRLRTEFLSVDPSPHYSRGATPDELQGLLRGASAFLPSQAEIEHLGQPESDWCLVAKELQASGFPEVVLKRGSAGCILATGDSKQVQVLPGGAALPVDLTGAGDAFSGAYAASRGLGHTPREATERALVAASMIIECSGAIEALQLRPQDASRRLDQYIDAQISSR